MSSIIKVCMGSSCFARGNAKNLQAIQQYITDNKLDATVELIGLRCCEKCSIGPNVIIDEQSYEKVDKSILIDILDKYFGDK